MKIVYRPGRLQPSQETPCDFLLIKDGANNPIMIVKQLAGNQIFTCKLGDEAFPILLHQLGLSMPRHKSIEASVI